MEETAEERAARKALKKSKRSKSEAEDEDVEEEKPKPKTKRARHDEDEEPPMRRRTRSISNAEEVYPEGQSPESFRSEHQISVTGKAEDGKGLFVCPAPMTAFGSTPFAVPIRRALDAAGFATATPTQAQSWPIALAGRDVITVAKTGSGKTIGFLLPAFHQFLNMKDRRRGPPAILVLAPTRELACQIEEECVKFGRSSNIRSTCAYGGAPKSLQIRKIQAGLEVLIATPGRLNDLLEMGVVKLDQVSFLVLDEADRM